MSIESRLADFINLLLEETLASIQSSYAEQTERLLELARMADLDVDHFLENISEEDIELAASEGGFEGQDKEEIALILAQQQQSAIKLMVDQGFPKMIVSTGEISADTEFEISDTVPEKTRQARKPKTTAKTVKPAGRSARPSKVSRPVAHEMPRSLQPRTALKGTKLAEQVLTKVPLRKDLGLGVKITPNTPKTGSGSARFNVKLNFTVQYE